MFKKYFDSSAPTDLANKLYKAKDAKENIEFVEEIRKKWSILKDETEKMSKEEIENEKPNDISEIVDEIFDFNKEIQKQPN